MEVPVFGAFHAPAAAHDKRSLGQQNAAGLVLHYHLLGRVGKVGIAELGRESHNLGRFAGLVLGLNRVFLDGNHLAVAAQHHVRKRLARKRAALYHELAALSFGQLDHVGRQRSLQAHRQARAHGRADVAVGQHDYLGIFLLGGLGNELGIGVVHEVLEAGLVVIQHLRDALLAELGEVGLGGFAHGNGRGGGAQLGGHLGAVSDYFEGGFFLPRPCRIQLLLKQT